jgi:predicted TIM-barrel fold metal-dependent hydrolase
MKYPNNVKAFIHLDPNNPDMIKDFNNSIDILKYDGVKIYPPASCVLPTDDRLTYVYEKCNDIGMSILAHCGAQSPTHYHSSKKKLRKLLDKHGLKWNKNMGAAELCGQFTHPKNYIPILEKYPNMNICLGHWGSEKAWKEYLENPTNTENWFYIIKEMIKKYPNLYTDISFTLNDDEYFSVLKIFLQNKDIKEKVLFGTDYYMVESKSTEKKFCFDLRAYLSEELFEQIANINPKKYLKIS